MWRVHATAGGRAVATWVEVHDVLNVNCDFELPAYTAHGIVDRKPAVDLAPSVVVFESASLAIPKVTLPKSFIETIAMNIYRPNKVICREYIFVKDSELQGLILQQAVVGHITFELLVPHRVQSFPSCLCIWRIETDALKLRLRNPKLTDNTFQRLQNQYLHVRVAQASSSIHHGKRTSL